MNRKEIKELEQDIRRLEKRLDKKRSIFDPKQIEKERAYLKGLEKELGDIESNLEGLYGIFQGNLDEITKTNVALNSSKSAIRGLSSLASKLSTTYNSNQLISEKELDLTKKKIAQEKLRLRTAIATGELLTADAAAAQDSINKADEFLETLRDIRKEQEIIKDTFGVGMFSTISKVVKSIPGLSGLSEPFENAAAATIETAKQNEKMFKGLSKEEKDELIRQNAAHNKRLAMFDELKAQGLSDEEALSGVQGEKGGEDFSLADVDTGMLPEGEMNAFAAGAKELAKGLKDALGPVAVFMMFFEALKEANEQATYMQKTLLMTEREAVLFRTELSEAALASNNINVTTSKILKTYQAITEQFGFISGLSAETLATTTKLTEQVGLEAEAAGSLAMLSASTGGNLEDQFKNALAVSHEMQVQEGVQFDLRKLLEETAAITGVMRAQLGASTEAMVEAVTQAKLLGGSLDDVAGAGAAMLDFESSIANELQAELLLNRDINLEKARQAALNGDLATLGQELKEQAGDFEEFSAMNVIQQEALAAAMGMQADQLADILFQQDIQGKTAKELRAMGKDELAAQLEQQTAADEFNATVDKLKDILVDVFAALEPILGIFTGILNIVTFVLSPLTALINWANSFGSVMGTVVSLLTAAGIAALFLNGTLTMGVGVAIALAAIAGGMAYFNSEMGKADDLLSAGDGTSGYGKRTLIGPEGAIALNNKDTIVAGTDLFSKGDDILSAPAGTMSMGDNNKETNSLLRELVTQNKKKPQMSPVGLYEIQ